MSLDKFSAKKFFLTLLMVYVITYIIAFIIVGIMWDPNGVNLFERPIANAMSIIGIGLLMSLSFVIDAFPTHHPIPVTMGLGFFACLVVGLIGIRETTGRLLLYVLLAFFTVLGVVQFCLSA